MASERPRPSDATRPLPETIASRAEHAHWESVYADRDEIAATWSPASYEDRVIVHYLQKELHSAGATSVLEVGCGDSALLPYLGRSLGLRVAGIDYVERGCELARDRLRRAGVNGCVTCADVFSARPEEIGTFDAVYSLGFVEHFNETIEVIGRLGAFVRPGGRLITEVPNMFSMHGLLSWIWQPELLRRHVILRARHLRKAYEALGYQEIRTWHAGVFSLAIVAWEYYPRWPALKRPVCFVARRVSDLLQRCVMRYVTFYRGMWLMAPYLFVSGTKAASG